MILSVAARDADDGYLLLGFTHLTTFRPLFSLLWVALVGHLLRPARLHESIAWWSACPRSTRRQRSSGMRVVRVI
jgi:hypothetical protein